MKLVIDIDEELYKAYKGRPPMLGDDGMDMIARAVANGIPYEERPQGEWIRLDLAKRVIAKFKGYLDEDMIERIQIALEKEYKVEMQKGGTDCMDEDAKQASIPYTYNAPQFDWKCGYPDITRGKGGAE